MLERLALAPAPALSGHRLAVHARARSRSDERYKVSRLSVTELGRAILAQAEDFSRHNPIDRWWGGTHLTNDHLWRWDRLLIAP